MNKSERNSFQVSSDESYEYNTKPSSFPSNELLARNRKLLVHKKLIKTHNEPTQFNSSSEESPVFKRELNHKLKSHILKYYHRERAEDESMFSSEVDTVPEDIHKKEHFINASLLSEKSNIGTDSKISIKIQAFDDNFQIEQPGEVIHNEGKSSKRSIRNKKREKTPKIAEKIKMNVPRSSFLHVIRDIMRKYPNFGIHSNAIAALHESSEIMLIDLFEDVNRYASHREKITIGVKDIQLAKNILKKYDKLFA